MWPEIGEIDNATLRELKPERMLYDFDGLHIFIALNKLGKPLLAYQCDEYPAESRFIVASISEQTEQQLTSGITSVHAALQQSQLWLMTVDIENNWQVLEMRRVTFDDIPAERLPQPGTMLWSHLEAPSQTAAEGSATVSPVQAPTLNRVFAGNSNINRLSGRITRLERTPGYLLLVLKRGDGLQTQFQLPAEHFLVETIFTAFTHDSSVTVSSEFRSPNDQPVVTQVVIE